MNIMLLIPLFYLVSQAFSLPPQIPKCRFAPAYAQSQILKDPNPFISDVLYWEGKFHQNNIGYNTANGMTYDGTLLDQNTGLAAEKHAFSAASKESLQIMLYSHALAGSSEAARFLSPNNPKDAPEIAFKIMELKLKTYLRFNTTYPGFGGFIPWFLADQMDISPTADWVNRVPALDNGELLWAIYSTVSVLANHPSPKFRDLGTKWQHWLDYTKTTVSRIFYKGAGKICAVTTLNQSLPVYHPLQNYSCESSGVLNDPYEGELFAWWVYFFGGLKGKEKEEIWKAKRAQLVSVEYKMGGFGPVTVQKGFWFSSHEQWKVLQMPYHDIPLVKRLFRNAEIVRTCNSRIKHIPGLYASVNNSTDPATGQIIGYISPAGIPSVSFQTEQELDVVTPYGVFPTVLIDKAVGMVWWKNMVDGKKMQNPYGSSESTRIDGKLTSSFVSWDSKITTVVALLGGVEGFVREKMKKDGVYEEFLRVTKREHEMVFKELKGEHLDLCLPGVKVPDAGLQDYTNCRR